MVVIIGRGDDLPRGPARDEGRFERRPPPPSRFTQRAPVDLPTQPPFTAHIANLSFDANEDDLADFFRGLKVRVKSLSTKLDSALMHSIDC